MSNEARAIASTLATLKTQLATAIPLAIDAIIADSGQALDDPTGVDATGDVRGAGGNLHLTRVRVMVEGTVDWDQYMTPQVNLVLPLAIVATMHVSDSPEVCDQKAHEMCRALDIAMSRTWQNVAGAFWYRTSQSGVLLDPTPNASRNRRLAVLRGTLKVRTTRVET